MPVEDLSCPLAVVRDSVRAGEAIGILVERNARCTELDTASQAPVYHLRLKLALKIQAPMGGAL